MLRLRSKPTQLSKFSLLLQPVRGCTAFLLVASNHTYKVDCCDHSISKSFCICHYTCRVGITPHNERKISSCSGVGTLDFPRAWTQRSIAPPCDDPKGFSIDWFENDVTYLLHRYEKVLLDRRTFQSFVFTACCSLSSISNSSIRS